MQTLPMLISREGDVKIVLKRWFGRIELYVIVEKWRDRYASINQRSNPLGSRFGFSIVDREFWEALNHWAIDK